MATTYDLHYALLSEADQRASNGKMFTFGFTSAVAVRGPQKLVNRWLKCFLTPKFSDPIDKTYGTTFADLLGGNPTQEDFVDTTTLAVDDCNTQMFALDRATTLSDDERLGAAHVASISPLGADGYTVYISITSVAGLSALISVPTGV